MAHNNLFRQSVYFEIWSVDNQGNNVKLLESMALTVPPESMRIKQGQRISKTPTPGGMFVDIYGLDVASISISGKTGNHEGRLTVVGPGKAPRYYTGQQAYFEFRDRIVRFSDTTQKPYKMFLYDLTHRGSPNIFRNNGANRQYSDAWEVVLGDYTTDRSGSTPFFYPVSIDFTGIKPIGKWNPSAARATGGKIGDVAAAIDNAKNQISNALAQLDYLAGNLISYVDDINSVLLAVQDMANYVNVFETKFFDYQNQVVGIFNNSINTLESVLISGIQVIEFPYKEAKALEQSARNVYNEYQSMITNINSEMQYVSDIYDWGSNDLSSTASLDSQSVELSRSIEPIMVVAKQTSSQDPLGSIAINGVNTPIYSYLEIVATDSMTLERLALDQYGDPDLSYIISAANDIWANDEIVIGDTLVIPVLESSSRLIANQVYTSDSESTEILGRDVMLDDVGNIVVVSAGDYQVTESIDTVEQSVFIKMSEEQGRQLRDQTLGVLTIIGGALGSNAPIDILTTSIKESLLQDPRITDVFDLDVIATKDVINQTFRYITISDEEGTYSQGGI